MRLAGPLARPFTRRRSPRLVVLLALVATGVCWAVLAPKGSAADTAAQNEAVRQGRALYLQGCSSCHGLSAEGGNQAPSLIGAGSAAIDFQVGTGRMPLAKPGAEAEVKRPSYTQTEIDQLGAYIDSLAPGPKQAHVTQQELDDADLAYGGELFRTNCSQCHQAAGEGGALTYGKQAPALGKATPNQIIEAMRTGPENMPVFGAGQIPDSKAVAIAKYVRFVTHTKDPGGDGLGHFGPIPEGLVVWIVGIGGLVGATLWIGSRKF